MKYYLAPLEGITGYIYRNAFYDFFGGEVSRYFSPFIMPHDKHAMTPKETRDIHPSNNCKYTIIPQVMTNSAIGFLRVEHDLHELGYDEVNINLGCPSKTVIGKGRGSGFLRYPEELDAFLADIFDNREGKISIKTRIGFENPEEFYELLDIYNKYEFTEVIIHPRVGKEMYKGTVHMDMFQYAVTHCKSPLCYNGDICSVEDERKLLDSLPEDFELKAIMIGRGTLRNPSLIRELSGGQRFDSKELLGFLNRLIDDYTEYMSGEVHVLHKIKEQWIYLADSFPEDKKLTKQLFKAKTISELKDIQRQIIK